VVDILVAIVRLARREKAVLLELRALLWRRERNIVEVEESIDLWICCEAQSSDLNQSQQ
jgi:hypothetical protein